MSGPVRHQPASARSAILKVAATGLAGTLAYAALAPFVGFGSGVDPAFLTFLVVSATWLITCSIITRAVGQIPGMRFIVFVVGLVLTFGYFQLELRALAYAVEHLLPRPVFHNRFVWHERSLLPYWYPPIPVHDEFGHWIEADYESNLLAMALAGPAPQPWLPIRGTTSGFTVHLGKQVDFGRMTDALVIVQRNGHWQRFHLPPGAARAFHEKAERQRPANLLRESRALLSAEDQAAFDTFLTGYAERIPGQRRSRSRPAGEPTTASDSRPG